MYRLHNDNSWVSHMYTCIYIYTYIYICIFPHEDLAQHSIHQFFAFFGLGPGAPPGFQSPQEIPGMKCPETRCESLGHR